MSLPSAEDLEMPHKEGTDAEGKTILSELQSWLFLPWIWLTPSTGDLPNGI